MTTHRAQLPLRSLALMALALCPAGVLAGGGIAGHDSNAPVDYAADRIELQDKQQRVLLTGNVEITQGELHLRAARALVSYTNEGALKIQRIDASGAVHVARGEQTADGDVATYDFNARIITMGGNVVLHQKGDVLRGARMVVDLKTSLASVNGQGSGDGGRVSGTFAVPQSH